MLLAIIHMIFIGQSHACEALSEPPKAFQVAWISPVKERVGSKEMIEVVSFRDLRKWVKDKDATAKDLLHHLGMLKKGYKKEIDPRDYKITIFDIEQKSLCRPMKGKAGDKIKNVPICIENQQTAISRRHKHGFTSCGYAFDTKTFSRSIDVYRIMWMDAVVQGFCVLPLKRFLSES